MLELALNLSFVLFAEAQNLAQSLLWGQELCLGSGGRQNCIHCISCRCVDVCVCVCVCACNTSHVKKIYKLQLPLLKQQTSL